MNVGELIEKLSQYPKDKEVCINDWSNDEFYEISCVDTIGYENKDIVEDEIIIRINTP